MQVRAFERYISLMTPGLWLIRTTWTREVLHTEYKAVGHMVSEKIVQMFPIVGLRKINTPLGWSILTPGACITDFLCG